MRIPLYTALFLLSITTLAAPEYPFTDLPENIIATLNVNTNSKEPANNRLLGLNIFGFSKTKEQELIRAFDPLVIRFPHGVWANFYNWETDGYTRYNDTWPSEHAKTVESYEASNTKCGFPGLAQLHMEKKTQNNGVGYDIIWTYNINYDSPQKSVARLQHSEANGFDIKDIELGNEHFWKGQRSTATSTPEEYTAIARKISAALKQAKPAVRLSIPLSWRRDHAAYNTTLADNQEYFDAITVHKYTDGTPGPTPKDDKVAYGSVLTARLAMQTDVNWARAFAPGKPVWLSEWGISVNHKAEAVAALAMADTYLFLFENQNVYERANWFSVNGLSNSFMKFRVGRELLYPYKKTAFASVFEIIRSVFEDSIMLDGTMTTSKLTTPDGSIDAISARAVIRDGKTIVLAVNLTQRPCNFTLKFDNKSYAQAVVHEAMKFTDLSELVVLDFDASPLSLITNTPGTITLPPLSVNKISGISDGNKAH